MSFFSSCQNAERPKKPYFVPLHIAGFRWLSVFQLRGKSDAVFFRYFGNFGRNSQNGHWKDNFYYQIAKPLFSSNLRIVVCSLSMFPFSILFFSHFYSWKERSNICRHLQSKKLRHFLFLLTFSFLDYAKQSFNQI